MKETLIILCIVNIIFLIALVVVFIKHYKLEKSIDVKNKEELTVKEVLEKKEDEVTPVKKETFNFESLDLTNVKIEDKPIQLHQFISNINELIDNDKYKLISSTKVLNWLVIKGYINSQKVKVVREISKFSVTTEGEQVGIVATHEVDKNSGEVYPSYLLSEKAQKYILNEMVNIYSPSERKEKKASRTNHMTKWTDDEDEQLLNEYLNQSLRISEIARIHGRNPGAIKARLKIKHGLDVKYSAYWRYRRNK